MAFTGCLGSGVWDLRGSGRAGPSKARFRDEGWEGAQWHGLNGAGWELGSRPRFRARQNSEVSQAAQASWVCSFAASQDQIPMMDS